MRRKKLLSLSNYELVVAKQQRAGRPNAIKVAIKNDKKKKAVLRNIEPVVTTREFYVAAANARNYEKAVEFLKRYPFFTVCDDASQQPRRATTGEIERFGKIARIIFGNMQGRAKMRAEAAEYKTKYMPAPLPLIYDDIEFINRELVHCHPVVIKSLYTSNEPSILEVKDFEKNVERIRNKFAEQRINLRGIIISDEKKAAVAKAELERISRKEGAEMEGVMDDYASPRIFIYGGPRRNGGTFYRVEMQCEDSMAACCYYLLQDLANEEEVRICPQCDRLFIATTKRQAYCGNKDCMKMVARVKSRRSYKKKKKTQNIGR